MPGVAVWPGPSIDCLALIELQARQASRQPRPVCTVDKTQKSSHPFAGRMQGPRTGTRHGERALGGSGVPFPLIFPTAHHHVSLMWSVLHLFTGHCNTVFIAHFSRGIEM